MGTKTVALGITLDGEKLEEKIRDSQYMKNAGYSVHYDVEITAKEAAEDDRKYKGLPPNEVVAYALCLVQGARQDYIHFRVRPGQVSEFHYFAYVTDENQLSADLAELVKELNIP